MRRIGCRVQLDGTVPGFFLGALLVRRRCEDREVPFDFRTRVPLSVRNAGRQNDELPRTSATIREKPGILVSRSRAARKGAIASSMRASRRAMSALWASMRSRNSRVMNPWWVLNRPVSASVSAPIFCLIRPRDNSASTAWWCPPPDPERRLRFGLPKVPRLAGRCRRARRYKR
jgi:hypothetical protein